jgi:DNA-binding transcriptional LysR family regulator
MNYTINQLRIFLKVVELKSITKAAEELYMTQPAVSIQLRNFQDQFSIPLTELVGRNIQITEFGLEIAAIADKVMEELNNLKFKTKDFEGLISGKLKVSSASTGKYVIPFFLSGFLDLHDKIELQLDVTNKSRVMENLKNNEIDFAVVSVVPSDIEVNEEVILENKLYIVAGKENWDKEMPLIYRESGSATRLAMETYFAESKQNVTKKIELTSNEAVKQALIAGMGHSIIPIIGIKDELTSGKLKIINKKGLPVRTDWRLIWLKNKKLSPVAKAYLEYVRANKEEIKKENFSWYEGYKPS